MTLLRRSLLVLLPAVLFFSIGCAQSGRSPSRPQASIAPRAAMLAVAPPTRNANPHFYPSHAPDIRAESVIMIDARTGRTIHYKNPDMRRPVASTQKLLTALVVLDRGRLNAPITIQPEDTKVPPSKLYLKPGDVYTRAELLRAFLVKSANDAAMALARDAAGSVPAFAGLMNQKARQLGAYQSNFVNPHGLTASGQFSSARDVARIAFHAYRNPFIRQTVRLEKYSLVTPTGVKELKNTNKLLDRMPGCNGMKTGSTRASGRCLVSSCSRGGRSVILVQLGTKTEYIWDDGELLMNWGLRNLSSGSRVAYH